MAGGVADGNHFPGRCYFVQVFLPKSLFFLLGHVLTLWGSVGPNAYVTWGTPFETKDSDAERKTGPERKGGALGSSPSLAYIPPAGLPASSPAAASSPQKAQPPARAPWS